MTIDSTIDQQIDEATTIAWPTTKLADISQPELDAVLRQIAEAGRYDPEAVMQAARRVREAMPSAERAAQNLADFARMMGERG